MLCPRCGNILDESETSCKNCGTKITQAEVAADENQPIEYEQVNVQPQPDAQQVEYEQPVQPVAEAVQYQEQPVYQQQYVPNKEKMNNKILIIAIVLIVVVSVGIGFLMIKKAQSTEAGDINAISGSEKNIDTKMSTATEIEMYGYKITIPSNYETKVDNLMVYSVDYKNKVQLVFTIMRNVSYDSIAQAPEDFKNDLQTLGFDVESYSELRVGERRWLLYNVILSEKNSSYDAIYAITSMGVDGSTFHVTIINVGAKTKNSVFSEIGDFLDKAEYTGKNMNGPSGGNNSGSANSGSNNGGANSGSTPGGTPASDPSNNNGGSSGSNPGSVSA